MSDQPNDLGVSEVLPDQISVESRTVNGNGMSIIEVTGLVNMFAGMLDRMEQRIIARLDDNSRMASERWAKHDQELERNREAVVARFLAIEKGLDDHLTVANERWAKEHDEDVRMDARVQPVKNGIRYAMIHWRTIVLFVLIFLTMIGVIFNAININQLHQDIGQ